METILFDIGEYRHVRLEICHCKGEEFRILSASWELARIDYDNPEDMPEDNGTCSIDGHVIDMMINPAHRGFYRLKVTYHIADETLVDVVKVKVV